MKIPTVHDRYSRDVVEEYYRAGCWTTDTFGQVLAQQAGERGEKTCITDGTLALTYQQLYEESLRLAVGLRRRGIGAGDRVVVQMPNWSEFGVITAALARIGAILVPIMPIYRRDEVGHVLDDSGARAAITTGPVKDFDYLEMYRELRADRPALETIAVVRGEGVASDAGVIGLRDLVVEIDLAAAEAELGAPIGPDEPFVIVYTSGTTARPKGCVHTFNTYASGARALAKAFAYTESDVQFGPSPVTHTTGLVTSILLPLLHGGATHLMPEWDPVQGLADVEKYRCSVTVTATTFLQMLLDAYDPDRHDATSLRVWVSAGAPIPRAIVERARALLPAARILSLYGRSENLATTTCTVDDDPERSLTSDGAALPYSSVKVVDELGAEVPRGAEGDIAYRGPTHMLGYLNKPEETAALFTTDGYSRSGDLGRMDEDGYVRVTGRIKDIVIRGGMNISVREVEDLLITHPAVNSVAVVGMPDERLGEKVCAYVVPNPGHDSLSLEELKSYLLDKGVAIQKTPERLELIDKMPMTPTGKIQKHLLRDDIARKVGLRTEVTATS